MIYLNPADYLSLDKIRGISWNLLAAKDDGEYTTEPPLRMCSGFPTHREYVVMEATSVPSTDWMRRPAALIISHPGHEVLLHGWLEQARPLVFILTDGCDMRGYSAMQTTQRILHQTGSRRGSIFGRYPERRLLCHLLKGELERFLAVAEELAEAIQAHGIHCVVADAAEGNHPTHDLCRLLADAAVTIASHKMGGMRNGEFSLYAQGPKYATFSVDADSWDRKFTAARAYPACVDELWYTIRHHGVDTLREECLRPSIPWSMLRRSDVLYHGVNERMPIPDGDYWSQLQELNYLLRDLVAGAVTPAPVVKAPAPTAA